MPKPFKRKEKYKMSKLIVKLVGVSFGDAPENIKKFGCKDIGSFAMVREPNNADDPNAIRVELGKFFMGYIPREVAKGLAPRMDSGERFIAMFIKRNESKFPNGRVGMTVELVKYADEPIVNQD
jgi:hypothetical protein